jgi:hypothetical protein
MPRRDRSNNKELVETTISMHGNNYAPLPRHSPLRRSQHAIKHPIQRTCFQKEILSHTLARDACRTEQSRAVKKKRFSLLLITQYSVRNAH